MAINYPAASGEVVYFFMQHPNEVFSPEALLGLVWSSESEATVYSLYTCVRRLRKKIDVEGKPSLIRTVHSTGYMFAASEREKVAQEA